MATALDSPREVTHAQYGSEVAKSTDLRMILRPRDSSSSRMSQRTLWTGQRYSVAGSIYGPSPPVAVHERGSHGWRGEVDPEAAERFGLLASGPATVVVVTERSPAPDGVLDVEDGEPVADAEDEGEGITAKLEPVTTTTSAFSDAGRGEPTSMVSEVEPAPAEAPAWAGPPPATSPGS